MPIKQLYFIRHAHAEPAQGRNDSERPLTAVGREEALQLGKYLQGQLIRPDRVITSTAARTIETSNIIQNYFPDTHILEEKRLYNASFEEIIDIVHMEEDTFSSLVIIAHNPGLHQCALHLVGDGEEALLSDLAKYFPPATFVSLTFNGYWSDLKQHGTTLVDFKTPKHLGVKPQ